MSSFVDTRLWSEDNAVNGSAVSSVEVGLRENTALVVFHFYPGEGPVLADEGDLPPETREKAARLGVVFHIEAGRVRAITADGAGLALEQSTQAIVEAIDTILDYCWQQQPPCQVDVAPDDIKAHARAACWTAEQRRGSSSPYLN